MNVEEERAREDRKVGRRRRKAAGFTALWLVLLGGPAFAFGALTAYEAFWVVGIFLASQVGVPIVLSILLAGVGRVLRDGIGDTDLAQATGGLPRAGYWALIVFLFFHTFTNVWQLAIGLGLAILTFQVYATFDRMRRAGHRGFGPGLPLTFSILGAYALWLGAFYAMGTVGRFDLLSAIGTYAFAFLMLRIAVRSATQTHAHAKSDASLRDRAPSARGATAKHLLGAIFVGYLFFRFFVSAHVPYGPIVEWFIICVGALFFAIIAAARIGTVPTHRSLPPQSVRTHEQRVWSLPDDHISRIEGHLADYIHDNKQQDWVQAHYRALLEASDVPEEDAAAALARLHRARNHPDDRRAVIHHLTRLLDEPGTNGGPADDAPAPAAGRRPLTP